MQYSHGNSLFLLRSPFQAWLAKKIIIKENIKNFDVVYFTHNDSDEDVVYYEFFKNNARKCNYYFIKIYKYNFITLVHLFWVSRAWLSDKKYQSIFLSSIDNYIINSITNKQSGNIYTLDDGLGNIICNSHYYIEKNNFRDKLYRCIFDVVSINDLKLTIKHHYTIFPNLPNILSREKLITLSSWIKNDKNNSGTVVTYFIGQPFKEILSNKEIKIIELFLSNYNIDFYVRHPRERHPLNLKIPFLEKRGRIAEDAILNNAQNNRIRIIGVTSNVLMTTSVFANDTLMIIPSTDEIFKSFALLGQKLGFRVINV